MRRHLLALATLKIAASGTVPLLTPDDTSHGDSPGVGTGGAGR